MTLATAPVRYRFAHFELQLDERRLLAGGEPAHLGPHAFDLLVALVQRSGSLVTKDELLSRVWGRTVVEENTLQAHISALRKVLGSDAIATVSGRGYRFILEAAPDEPPRLRPRHNLPQQLTTFIGREADIARMARLLVSARMITLTGAGGCGKTRLALQTAGQMHDAYPDGVWLVELAPLGDPALVVQAVARALAIEEQPGRELVETVAEWLEPRRILLLLDNAEHLLEASAQLADRLLRRCPHLAILATSRQQLGVTGEVTYRVASLSLPEAPSATVEEVLACEASRLFVDRARLQCPGFVVADEEAAALASICRRLDGIALAIELAAPKVRVMSLPELSKRLDDRFGVLTGGSRAALARHRTLRSLIDWSHELLSDAEKAVLRRASLFVGGWTLASAEQVCAGGEVDRGDVLDLLTSLTDKSLFVAETQGDETRFGMLETVRHYAQDRLRESGEDAEVRGRHLGHFLDRVERLEEAPSDEERQGLLSRLERERENLRAALAGCTDAPDRAVAGLRLAGRLHWFWATRGGASEGRAWIARLMDRAPIDGQERAHATALHAAGALACMQGELTAAEAHYRNALALWERLGDRQQIVRSLGGLGNIAMERDDLPLGNELYGQALALAREIGDRQSIALALYSLAVLAFYAGNLETAEALQRESASITREAGGRPEAHALVVLGMIRQLRGDAAGARTLLLEGLEAYRAYGDRLGVGEALRALGGVALDEGDLAKARSQLGEALAIHQPLGEPAAVVSTLEELAGAMQASANPLAAARLFGAAQRGRDATGYPRKVVEQGRYEGHLAAARDALNDSAAFDRAWSEGRSWTLDEAVRYARSL